MTIYKLKVNVPDVGWLLALKTNDMVLMVMKKVDLENKGHEVQLIREGK